MSNPWDKATSKAPPTVGEGCVRRYDPKELGEHHGTEFPEAAQLWRRLQEQSNEERGSADDKPEDA